jgi:gliding motility-associated-like protein
MIKITFKKYLLILSLFTFNFAFSSHISGGNISYSCTGNPNEYLITLSLYRDCSGVSAPNTPSVSFSNSCGLANPASLNLTIDNILSGEISQLCTSELPNSICNGGTLPGYEQYVYTGLVTFPGPCDSWTISYDICNRNAATNLSGGNGNCFYIESQIFSQTNACNNSPTIVNQNPVPYVCNGQPATYDYGIGEVDGNTLQFSFVNALDVNATNIGYNAGYSASSPIPGISINSTTGQLTFTPGLVGNFVVTIMIQEFDANGNLIGTMIHDTQFVVQNCTNNSVQSSSGGSNFQNNGTNAVFSNGNTITMCGGDQFCIDVVFTDPDVGDILQLETNATTLLPGATFTQTGTNPATGTLCWTYQSGYLGNLISITATDNACPTPSNSSVILNLDIPPPLNVSANDTICGNEVAQLQAIGTPPLTWSSISGDPIIIGTNFSCNNCTNPIATPTVTTMYEVMDGSVCQLRDTIVVAVVQNHNNIFSNIYTNDTSVCSGECFNINAEAIEEFSGTTQVSFQNSTSVNILDNQDNISYLTVSGLNMTNLNIGSIESICIDITHTWDSDLSIYLQCPDGTQFELSSNNGGSSDNYSNTCFTLSATQSITSGSAPFSGSFSPEGGLLSNALVGCSANGLWSLHVVDGAGGDQGTINNWSIIFNDEIPNQGPASSLTWSNTNGLTNPTSATSQLCPLIDGEYILFAYDVNNCWDSDTLNVTITNPLNAGLDSTINICKEVPQIDLFSQLGGSPDLGGVWINSSFDTITQFILPDTIVSGSVFGYLIGTPPCSDTAYVTVNVFEVTATDIVTNSDCNACNGSIAITPSGYYGSIADVTFTNNGGVSQSSNTFNSLCGGVPGTNYSIVITDSIGCQFTINETVIDDNFPDLQSINNTDSECGLDDGEVTSAVTVGGTSPYIYLVEGLTSPFQNLPIQNLPPSTPTTYNLVVEDAMGCHDTLAFTVNQINPPIISATPVVDNICNGGADGQIEVQGTNLNYFSIDGGTTVQVSNIFDHLPAGTYNITAYSSDPATTNACSDIANNIVITEPNALDVYNLSPDVTICPDDNITISAEQQGGMGNAILTWSVNGNNAGIGGSIDITPTVNSQVCVTISEGNCYTDSECMNISLPTPIIPSFVADTTNGCFPVNVTFTNTSSNQADIQSVYWNFENAGTGSGNPTALSSFTQPGVYDISMQVTSVYGCLYDTTYADFIEVFDYPKANFTPTPIPLTIYDTQVQFHDLSSDDVISWEWDMGTGASPQFSNEQSPASEYPQGIPAIYPVTLIVSNEHQCFDTLIGQVEVINDVVIYAPNVFTPDNDEFNQTWRVYISGIDIYDYHLILFNRWGEIIWESYNPDAVWNGKYGTDDVEDGTYVWVLHAKDTYNDKKYEYRGTVSVLR